MLHDITACEEISHAFSHCIWRWTVAVFEVCIQVQTGRLYHEIHQCLPRKRRGVENSCTFLTRKISQAALKRSKELKLMECIHFFSRCNCVHKKQVIPNCCPFLLDSWRQTWTTRQENCPLLPKSLFDVEDMNKSDWRESEWWINCKAILWNATKDIFSCFQSQTRMPFICHAGYTTLLWT